jgi:hypothetical protein
MPVTRYWMKGNVQVQRTRLPEDFARRQGSAERLSKGGTQPVSVKVLHVVTRCTGLQKTTTRSPSVRLCREQVDGGRG